MCGVSPTLPATIMQFKTTPYQHQLKEFNETKDREAWALLWEMGTGKSKVVIDTASHLYLEGKIDAVLIVAPNGVAQNWCWKEIPVHMPICEDLPIVSMICYESKKAKTKNQKEACKKLLKSECLPHLIMTYDGFMTKAGSAYVKKFLEKRRCLFVLDEGHRIKTAGAKRTQRIVAWGKKAPYRRILTGTPITIAPWDIYSQIKFLDKTYWMRNGFGSLQSFKTHFGVWDEGWNPHTNRTFPKLVEHRNLEQLGTILEGISSRVTKDEVLDLPPRTFTQRFVEMTPEQKKMYKQLKDKFFIDLDQGPDMITAPFAMTRLLRFQQILCGYLSDDGKVVHEFDKNPRLDMLCDMLENDITGQVIIWSRFTHTIDQIMDRLGKEAVRYDGQVKDADRQGAVEEFQRGDRRVFVGNQAAGGTGLTLTAGTTMLFYSNSFIPEHRWQSLDRNHRIGQEEKTTVIDLIGGAVDQKLVDTLAKNEKMAATICRDELKEWI